MSVAEATILIFFAKIPFLKIFSYILKVKAEKDCIKLKGFLL